jgi:hypothetical protein
MAADLDAPVLPRTVGLAELVQAIYAEHYRLEAGHSLVTAALDSIATDND